VRALLAQLTEARAVVVAQKAMLVVAGRSGKAGQVELDSLSSVTLAHVAQRVALTLLSVATQSMRLQRQGIW
jgi:hypothetical protein